MGSKKKRSRSTSRRSRSLSRRSSRSRKEGETEQKVFSRRSGITERGSHGRGIRKSSFNLKEGSQSRWEDDFRW